MSDRAAHRGIVYITEADLDRLRTLIAVMKALSQFSFEAIWGMLSRCDPECTVRERRWS
jgi:hypothetical protein